MDTLSIPGKNHGEEESLKKAFFYSLIAHAIFLVFVSIRIGFFSNDRTPHVPTLQVDLVGLPDLTKAEIQRINQALPTQKTETKPEVSEPKSKPAPEVEKAEEHEMVVERTKPKPEKESKVDRVQRKDKMDSAIRRIEALQRIKNETESQVKAPILVKGNQVSQGTSLSGETNGGDASKYYDQVLGKLQMNWSLPVWLSRQSLQAQVVVFINAYGKIQGIRFLKNSGNAQFDDAVKQCITSSEPFPLPPETLRNSLLADGVLLGFPL